MQYTELNLESYCPEELEIRKIEEREREIRIWLKSRTKSCVCSRCQKELTQKRATYERKVQDLPILGKQVWLIVKVYEYQCPDCNRPVAESFEDFLKPVSRMTERCAELIVRLALETSCEGASRILQAMGIQYSGDSVIRLLLKRLEAMPEPEVGSVIGVDDFAFKKRNTYGTIIVDAQTHKPAAILDGRDGKALKEWLKRNKQVRIVTRDRASAYAKVIEEELPDAMQIADRFHLHQNFLESIKKVLNSEIPNTVPAEAVDTSSFTEDDKKRTVVIE